MPVLRRNDRQETASEYVKFLQERLRTYNFTSLKADGFFGKETEDAVIEYQERGNDHDPTISVDGIVGTKTWEALQITEEHCRDLQKTVQTKFARPGNLKKLFLHLAKNKCKSGILYYKK